MTTVASRVRKIADLEGFDIKVFNGGSAIDTAANGVMGNYAPNRAARSGWTVNRWIADRFKANYPKLECEVLMANGEVASGQTMLRNVRESYEADE